jgi:hypothetical protein
MFRRPPIVLLVAIFAVGPVPLQALHLYQANRQWQQIAATLPPTPAPIAGHPLKRLPVKLKHDPATCILCINLHAPATAPTLAPPALHLFPQFQFISPTPARFEESRQTLPNFCRGPPIL